MEGGNAAAVGLGGEAGDGEGGVEVLADLGDYPIGDGPGVDPGDGAGRVEALGEDGGAEGGDAVRDEAEFLAAAAGEEVHQKLVRRGAVEPPLEVGGEDLLDCLGVAAAQGVIQGAHHPFVSRILQNFRG